MEVAVAAAVGVVRGVEVGEGVVGSVVVEEVAALVVAAVVAVLAVGVAEGAEEEEVEEVVVEEVVVEQEALRRSDRTCHIVVYNLPRNSHRPNRKSCMPSSSHRIDCRGTGCGYRDHSCRLR